MMKKLIVLSLIIILYYSLTKTQDPREFIQSRLNQIPNIAQEVERAIQETKNSVFNQLKNQEKYADKREAAVIKTDDKDLFADEAKNLKAREAIVKEKLKSFLGKNENLKIAFAGSGGGYRAMIYTLGALQGAHETGLLDTALYMSALSGSTWALNAFMESDGDIKALSKIIRENLEKNRVISIPGKNIGTPVPADLKKEIHQFNVMIENFFKKYLFNQPLTSIDIWGAAIANNILEKQDYLLSNQQDKVKAGSILPINTAASPQKAPDYHWYEFTPFDVRNLNTNQFVPTWAFGKTFKDNKSTDNAPEQALSFYLGTFGSAFAVNIEEIIRIGNVSEVISEALSQKIVDLIFDNVQMIRNKLKDFITTQKLPTHTPTIPAKVITPEHTETIVLTPEIPETRTKKCIPFTKICKTITIPAVPAITKTITIPAVTTPEIPGVEIPTQVINEVVNDFVNKLNIKQYKEPTKQTIKQEIKAQIDKALEVIPMEVKGARFFPAKLPGFDGQDVTLIDAGIDANIPLMPLVKRGVNAVIVLDASDPVKNAPELEKALNEMKKNGIIDLNDYPDLLPYSKYGTKSINFITSKGDAPTIIYIPMAKDADLKETEYLTPKELADLKEFNPAECTQKSDCNTFNFKYAPENFQNLFNLGKYNVVANIEKIKDALRGR